MQDAEAVESRLGPGGKTNNELKFAALLAGDEKGVLHPPRAESLLLVQRLEECTHLGCRHLGHLDMRMRHCHPASAALDAVDDEECEPPGREILPIGARGGACGQGARGEADARGGSHGEDGIYAQRGETHAAVFGHEARGPVSRAQDGLFVLRGGPYRTGLVATRQHPRHGAAGRERFEMPPQFVVRQHARKIHQGILVGEIPLPHAAQGVVRGMPARGRIDDQERAAFLAKSRPDEKRARPHILVARQRGNAQEIEIIGGRQREKTRPIDVPADHVIVGQRRAVVAVAVRIDISRGQSARRIQGPVGPLSG